MSLIQELKETCSILGSQQNRTHDFWSFEQEDMNFPNLNLNLNQIENGKGISFKIRPTGRK
jgi:hypothetical protein